SGADGVLDTYVLVKRCLARGSRDELGVVADAYAWIAVDRDFEGALALHAFVHATLHADVRAGVSAKDDGSRLEVTLAPRANATIEVEPVGALDPTPTSWASFLAIELAPHAGVSPEAVAKEELKKEAERTLRDALAKPLVAAYDARAGVVRGASSGRHRVAPNGSALEGPFPPTLAPTPIHVNASAKIAVRALCVSHAEHVLEADRRGDRVTLDDWASAEGEARLSVPPMPCAWVLAFRGETIATASVDPIRPPPLPEGAAPPSRDRWVSIDELRLEEPLENGLLSVVATTGSWRHDLGRAKGLPAIVALAPDEEVRIRLLRRDRESTIADADERLPLDAPGDVERTMTLGPARVHLRARVRDAP
ncbi:MAG TPA: hypothetical protein VIF62_14105, partial [Labilithrix sp.]